MPFLDAVEQSLPDCANPPIDFSQLHALSDILRIRAKDPHQTPIAAYPQTSYADFEYFNAGTLDRFVDYAAKEYHTKGRALEGANILALIGLSSLDWLVSAFAISRAGFTLFPISPRLPAHAISAILQRTGCRVIVHSSSPVVMPLVSELLNTPGLEAVPMVTRMSYDRPAEPEPFIDRSIRAGDPNIPSVIMHTSGSTGTPKTIQVNDRRCISEAALGDGDLDFVTLPLYHAFPLTVVPGRMYSRKTVLFPNPDLPITGDGIMAALNHTQPNTLCSVPYTLQLLVETEGGIETLRRCDTVLSTGAPCPQELGDLLVKKGLNFGTFVGASETGFSGSSLPRPKEDRDWDYIRPPPSLLKYIQLRPIDKEAHELIFLKEYPTLAVTNSNDPPSSYHSGDLVKLHPTIPGAWKLIGRVDDWIVLVNGEKIAPLAFEGHVKQHADVKEAAIFGVGRHVPGLLLSREATAKQVTDEVFIANVWPLIKEANQAAESYAQISRDMVICVNADKDVPVTDKGSMKRSVVYEMFSRDIEEAYSRLIAREEGTLVLPSPKLEKYLLDFVRDQLDLRLASPRDDFYAAGMNSLQAIQMRSGILKSLNLGGHGHRLGQNVVFEQGNAERLAKYLVDLREGRKSSRPKDSLEVMNEYIEKFALQPKNTILLTGATGGLGVHLLYQLLLQPQTDRVYCLIRGPSPEPRLRETLSTQFLDLPSASLDKLTALPCAFDEPKLGLSRETYATLEQHITHIIHAAWPVNFQLSLSSFTPSLQATHDLLELARSSKKRARFIFTSSVSVALATQGNKSTVPEEPIEDLSQAQPTGYAQSKLVAEKIIERSQSRDVNVGIYRVGQLVGDTKNGLWNDRDFYPAIIRTATALGVLPLLRDQCSWLPTDIAAKAILQAEHLDDDSSPPHSPLPSFQHSPTSAKKDLLRNLVSPHLLSWNDRVLPELKNQGLQFEAVPFEQWLHKLRQAAKQPLQTQNAHDSGSVDEVTTDRDQTLSNGDLKTNGNAANDAHVLPAAKLIDFFEMMYNRQSGDEGDLLFQCEKMKALSPALRDEKDVINSGLMGKMVARWMETWR